MGVPRSSKETWTIVFLPYFKWVYGKWVCSFLSKMATSGFMILSGLVILKRNCLTVLANLTFLKQKCQPLFRWNRNEK